MNTYPSPRDPEQRANELNIESTHRLLSILEAEANHELPLIRSDIPFSIDGITLNHDGNPIVGLEEFPMPRDPKNPNHEIAFEAGIHPEGFSKVTMIERYLGGCIGRLDFILRPGEVTKANGHRSGRTGSVFANKVEDDPVDANTFNYLIRTLPLAFESKRQRIIRSQKSSTLIGRTSLAISDWFENRRATKTSVTRLEIEP